MVEDIETVLRQLMQEYKSHGIDFVLGVCYNDSAGQRSYMVRHTGGKPQCRALTRMLWQALTEDTRQINQEEDQD